MIKDLARGVIAESTAKRPIFTRAIINLYDNFITDKDYPETNRDFRYTNSVYHVKYSPKEYKAKGKPFIVVSDILEIGRLRVKDFSELKKKAEEIPAVAWLFRNTDLCETHFEIAEQNTDMPVIITFNIVKYYNMLVKKIVKETGKEPEGSVFRTPLQNIIEKERFDTFVKNHKRGVK